MFTSTISKYQNLSGLTMEGYFFLHIKQQAAKPKDLLLTVIQDLRMTETKLHLSPAVFKVTPGICIQPTDGRKLRNSLPLKNWATPRSDSLLLPIYHWPKFYHMVTSNLQGSWEM